MSPPLQPLTAQVPISSVATDVTGQSRTTPPTAGNRLDERSGKGEKMTSPFITTAMPGVSSNYSNITNSTATNATTDTMTEYEKRLEVIVTGLCIGVAVLLCLWMACFLVEKRSQSKYMKRGADKQNVSQTRQYPHEVATVRKTLMEIYDMPMIRVAQSDDEGSEGGSSQTSNSGPRGRARLESDGTDPNSSTNISSSDQRTGAESSSSEDTLRKGDQKKFSEQKVRLDVPIKDSEKFGQWRPVAKAGLSSPGEVRSNRFLKTSPPPNQRRLIPGTRSPSILKKPSNFNANKSPPSILRFSRGRKSRDESTVDMNSLRENVNQGYSPRKHIKQGSALKTSESKKHKRTRFKMDEDDDDVFESNGAGANSPPLTSAKDRVTPKQLVTCEVHFETPTSHAPMLNGNMDDEDDEDNDDEDVTERTPLRKNVNFLVVEKPRGSRCKFNVSWEDTEGLPCTDV